MLWDVQSTNAQQIMSNKLLQETGDQSYEDTAYVDSIITAQNYDFSPIIIFHRIIE